MNKFVSVKSKLKAFRSLSNMKGLLNKRQPGFVADTLAITSRAIFMIFQ